ncbi:kelch-like protein 8 [Gigantopelta aegis]|uniref:kelch-like protein 8 n=1 Tax=Gigantopelta aegis TaxID=1735272 RepID=UPI001B88CD62|nr:kelch-like protein 8 [Gigantopelta aegis]
MPYVPSPPQRNDSLPSYSRTAPPIPPAPVKRNSFQHKLRPASEIYYSVSRASSASLRKMAYDKALERPGSADSASMSSCPIFTHEVKTLFRDSFKTLLEFYESGHLCDVELKVGDKSFKCHRTVLACASLYFRAMFTSEMAESKQGVVTIYDIDENAMEKLIRFVYTSKISLTTDNVQSILYASSILQIEAVAQACCDFMKTHLHPSNCIDVRNFAEQHNRVELMKTVDEYILDHFLEITGSPDFKNMPVNLLERLVSSPDLHVETEEQVYDALMAWVNHDAEARGEHLPGLISHVKLALMDPTFLMEKVETAELIKKNHDCRDYLDEAKYYQMSLVSLVPDVKVTPRTCPRKAYAGVLFCVGGRGASGDPFKSTECYDVRRNKWFDVAQMHTRRRHVGVCSVNGLLYAVGGHDGTEHLSSGEVFDPKTNKWKEIHPMATFRRGIALASLGGPIYAVGGLDDSTCFSTVERYDILTDSWSSVASMTTPRGGVGIASLKGHIYAIGGNDGTSSLDKCERYDPYLNKWTPIGSMNKKRAGAGVAVLYGAIYVVGGFDDNSPLDSVERYDPKSDTWSVVNGMLCCRGGVGLDALGGKLYAVGGHDGSNYLNSVEAFDPITDTWTVMRGIQQFRAGAGVTACDSVLKNLRKVVRNTSERLQFLIGLVQY